MMSEADPKGVEGLTPREIVSALDRHIVGQERAKRMVAIALRNRARRKLLPESLRDEVSPKNILMVGPTGVGKTEVSRRLSKLARAPFLKVEASKYTEVGYVGRDVDSMIRDLVEVGIQMLREERTAAVVDQAAQRANDRLLDLMLPRPRSTPQASAARDEPAEAQGSAMGEERWQRTREKLRYGLENGLYEDREVDLQVSARSATLGSIAGFGGGSDMDMMKQVQDMIERMAPRRPQTKRLPIRQARQVLIDEEVEGLVDKDKLTADALELVQQSGIIFIDEIDKIAGRSAGGHGPDVSREGVQRDILPIIEGSTVSTKHGMVSTEHILFIGSGAFHVAKPSDLIPELQGRFPLRVELDDLGQQEFRRILTEPENSLTRQYSALMATEGVDVTFTNDGIDEMAEAAYRVNSQTENIGARRLHTVIERVFENISFDAPEMSGQKVAIDRSYVRERLAGIVEDQDLSRYIL